LAGGIFFSCIFYCYDSVRLLSGKYLVCAYSCYVLRTQLVDATLYLKM
jgi:hypothetical protein